jgi:hypothetical protein
MIHVQIAIRTNPPAMKMRECSKGHRDASAAGTEADTCAGGLPGDVFRWDWRLCFRFMQESPIVLNRPDFGQ